MNQMMNQPNIDQQNYHAMRVQQQVKMNYQII